MRVGQISDSFCVCVIFLFFKKKCLMFIFERERERERERESMSGKGAKREGDTECKAGSRVRAVSTEPDAGLELTNHEIMT